MASHLNYGAGLFLLVLLAVSGVDGRPQITEEHQSSVIPASIVAGVVGLVGITLVVLICAEKKVNPNINKTGPPEWTRSLVFRQDMNCGFGDYSEGLHAPTPFHIVRERRGNTKTDAARWTVPLGEGKHVFEIYWPAKKNRGHSCCIGVGSEKLSLTKDGRTSLVGDHSESWALDLAKRAGLHFGQIQQKLALGIPDRFFAYFDMDSGKLGFGADVGEGKNQSEFYGYVCHGIPKNKTMYFMISMTAPNEHCHIHYRGSATPSGGYNLVDVPSPLQFSKDNLGNLHLVPPPAAPPAYMATTASGPVQMPGGGAAPMPQQPMGYAPMPQQPMGYAPMPQQPMGYAPMPQQQASPYPPQPMPQQVVEPAEQKN